METTPKEKTAAEKTLQRAGFRGAKDYEEAKINSGGLIAQDLGMWGEYFGLKITFENGRTIEVRIQEHEYNHIHRQAFPETEEPTK